MPRRRSRNRYRQIFDKELFGRPLIADGLPCRRCGFPMLAEPSLGEADPWMHGDCTEPPDEDSVAIHLVVHWARENGESAEGLWERITDHELAAAVQDYLRRWQAAKKAALKAQMGDARIGLPPLPPSTSMARAPSLPAGELRPIPRPAHVERTAKPSNLDSSSVVGKQGIDEALREVCGRLARRLEAAPAGRARIVSPSPTRYLAECVADLVAGLAKTVIEEPDRRGHESQTVILSLGIAEDARQRVADCLKDIALPTIGDNR